jgi:hypothetical protein
MLATDAMPSVRPRLVCVAIFATFVATLYLHAARYTHDTMRRRSSVREVLLCDTRAAKALTRDARQLDVAITCSSQLLRHASPSLCEESLQDRLRSAPVWALSVLRLVEHLHRERRSRPISGLGALSISFAGDSRCVTVRHDQCHLTCSHG